ncbi:hypothetical protein Tco_1134596, partial [Tanacetum coccineum]
MDKNNNVKGTKMVRVEYNWKPHIRNHCVVFGHNWQQCKKRERTAEEVTKGLKSNTYEIRKGSFNMDGGKSNMERVRMERTNMYSKTNVGVGRNQGNTQYNNWQTKMQWNKKKPNMENMGGNGKEKSFEEEFPKLPVKNAKEKSALSIPGNERQKNKFSVLVDVKSDNMEEIKMLKDIMIVDQAWEANREKETQDQEVGTDSIVEGIVEDNANPPPTNNRPVLPAALRAKVVRELHELHAILALVDSRLENNDSDDDEVLNELSEYENAGVLRRERIINSFDRDDLAFQCMIGFRKFTAYLNPFLPMNIISRKAYNTIMVEVLEGTVKNLVSIVRDVYVFVGSFTYITDFVVLEDIGEFIVSDMAEVLMGKPFRKITKLKYDFAKGLVSFTKIFDTYIFRMPRTIPRLMNFNWSKIPPLLELSQRDLMSELRHPYEKNKLMYKSCLNLGPKYQADESMKEWLIHGHVIFDEKKLGSS